MTASWEWPRAARDPWQREIPDSMSVKGAPARHPLHASPPPEITDHLSGKDTISWQELEKGDASFEDPWFHVELSQEGSLALRSQGPVHHQRHHRAPFEEPHLPQMTLMRTRCSLDAGSMDCARAMQLQRRLAGISKRPSSELTIRPRTSASQAMMHQSARPVATTQSQLTTSTGQSQPTTSHEQAVFEFPKRDPKWENQRTLSSACNERHHGFFAAHVAACAGVCHAPCTHGCHC